MGLEKFYDKHLQCLDKQITVNEKELKFMDASNMTDQKINFNNSNTASNKLKKRLDLKATQRSKSKKAKKYRRTIRKSSKKIKNICNYQARSFCKLSPRRKENLLSKKKLYNLKGKKLPNKIKNDLDKFTLFDKAKNVCRKYGHCNNVTLADIPYSKIFMKDIKNSVVKPLLNQITNKNMQPSLGKNLFTKKKILQSKNGSSKSKNLLNQKNHLFQIVLQKKLKVN